MTEPLGLMPDIAPAQAATSVHAKRLRGLLQLWNIFKDARDAAASLVTDFAILSPHHRSVFSKALVVDYAKPWLGNRGQDLRALLNGSDEISFLSHIISASGTHAALQELRNKIVAHSDEGYESVGIAIKAARSVNIPQHQPRDPGTLSHVHIPLAIRVDSNRAYAISDKAKLQEILEHIELCLKATAAEISAEAAKLRAVGFQHMHVLEKLTDVFTIELQAQTGTAAHFDVELVTLESFPLVFSGPTPVEPQIGSSSLEYVLTCYEPDPSLPGSVDVKGRGYHFRTMPSDVPGKSKASVSYPKYPYPAELPP